MKYLRCSIWILVVCSLSGCGRKPPGRIQNGNWAYDDSGVLSFLSAPVPAELAVNGINLVTSLGTFEPTSDGKWIRRSHTIPLPPPDQVRISIVITSESCTEEMKGQGYYRVDELSTKTGSWRDVQLAGTPSSWIYAFKGSNNKEAGYWISPQKLGDIDWSEL